MIFGKEKVELRTSFIATLDAISKEYRIISKEHFNMNIKTIITSIGFLATFTLAAPVEARASQRVLILGGGTPEAYYTVEPPHGVEFTIGRALPSCLSLITH